MRLAQVPALIVLLAIFAVASFAQVQTGTPPFGIFGGGPDTINLANLNTHLDIPVINKNGRGIPFGYSITYDGSIWTPTVIGSTTTWEPIGSWGWSAPDQGYTRYSKVTYENCQKYLGGGRWETVGTEYIFTYKYIDSIGTAHPFPGGALHYTGGCSLAGGEGSNWVGSTSTATDGSGYTITISSGFGTDVGGTGGEVTVTAASGVIVVFPTNEIQQDTNGNEITYSGGVFTDTLGQTALTAAGTAPSNTTYSYTAPSGATASYTMKYTSYTVQTNFGCSGVAEFGATSENLVSEIDLPDQGVNPSDKYTFTYEATPGFPGSVTGRLSSVTLPTGGTITYSYSGGSNGIVCSDGSTATLTRQTPDTGSNSWTYAHSESGTAWATTVTDPQGNQTVMNFQGIYLTEKQVYQGAASGTPLQTIVECYNGNESNCNSTAISLPITQTFVYTEWPGANTLESVLATTYNSYGLVTEVDESGYGTNAPGGEDTKTITAYASLGNGIVNRLSSVTVEDGSGNVAAETTYSYDGSGLNATSGTPQQIAVSGSRGNPTTVSSLVSGSTYLTKTYTYYDTGNVYQATDVNGAVTTYSYGSCGNSFPTSVSEPLSLSRSASWNCTGGVALTATDENNNTVGATYNDPYFWRPASTSDELSNVTNLSYSPTSVEAAMNFSSSTTDILATLDSLGRQYISQQRQDPSASTFDSVESTYNSLGEPFETTLPYSSTASSTCSAPCPGTATTYDALGRVTQTSDAGGGTVTYTYNQNDVYVSAGPAPSGENTKRKQLEYDALGRLTSVCEITGLSGSGSCGQTNAATGFFTTYTYNALDQLTGVSQGFGTQTRSYSYDGLGRITSETNPESGTTTYLYDSTSCNSPHSSYGDLMEKTDAAGNAICYYYDALHRMTSEIVVAGPAQWGNSGCRHFAYDNAGNGVLGSSPSGVSVSNALGRLVEAESDTCAWPITQSAILTDEWFSYDVRGEQTDLYESTPNSGRYYHSSEAYWANGVPKLIQESTLGYWGNYLVDGEGRHYATSGGSGQNPLTSTTYNAAGSPTQVTFGSGDSDSFTYDPNTGRMTQYKYTVGGQSVIGNLTWNALGTLGSLAIADPFNSSDAQTCGYSHDDLSRIASANCGSIWSQTFNYDAFGNIQKSGNSNFSATYSATTNQMTSIGSSTPSYDGAGNVTYDFLHAYSWNGYGHAYAIDGVGVTYDALDRPVEQNNSGSYSQFTYAPDGTKIEIWSAGSTFQKAFIPLPAGAAAVFTPSSTPTYYRHADWLGSARFASTPTQTMYSDSAYAPFGEVYAQAGTSDESFTGMNQDTVTNLYDFPAREYGIQGRWPSPDPAGLAAVDPTDPQTWNRYAYVRNNPLDFTDPFGLQGEPTPGPGGDAGPCTLPDGTPGICSITNQPLPGSANGGGGGQHGITPLAPPPFEPEILPPRFPLPQQRCAVPNFLNRASLPILRFAAEQTGKTVGLGLSGSAGLGYGSRGIIKGIGVAGAASGFLVVSPNGAAAFVFTWGSTPLFGPVTGAGASGGASVFASDATDPQQLSGWGIDTGGSLADLYGLSADGSLGSGGILSGAVSIGFGAGGQGHSAVITWTSVVPVCGENGHQ